MHKDYCVAGSQGSNFHLSLEVSDSDVVLIYGHNPTIDNCILLFTLDSVFSENRTNNTCPIKEIIKSNEISELYFAGLRIFIDLFSNRIYCTVYFARCQLILRL